MLYSSSSDASNDGNGVRLPTIQREEADGCVCLLCADEAHVNRSALTFIVGIYFSMISFFSQAFALYEVIKYTPTYRRAMHSIMYLSSFVGLALTLISPCSEPISTQLRLSEGEIRSITTSLPSATAVVNKYYGVPFAEPPVRFSPATPPHPWYGVKDVKEHAPICIQQFPGISSRSSHQTVLLAILTAGADIRPVMDLIKETFSKDATELPPAESRDCLYLDVYAPSSPPPPGGRAVIFGIPGGPFEQGGSVFYDGSSFAAYEDIVVVFINWRINGTASLLYPP